MYKSPGVEWMPPKLLKEIVERISIPLGKVFNLSLEGIVSSEWKEANITSLRGCLHIFSESFR